MIIPSLVDAVNLPDKTQMKAEAVVEGRAGKVPVQVSVVPVQSLTILELGQDVLVQILECEARVLAAQESRGHAQKAKGAQAHKVRRHDLGTAKHANAVLTAPLKLLVTHKHTHTSTW